jgi:hypothetical protein
MKVTSTIGFITEEFDMATKGAKYITICFSTGQFSETAVHSDIVDVTVEGEFLTILTQTGSRINYNADRVVWFREWVTM